MAGRDDRGRRPAPGLEELARGGAVPRRGARSLEDLAAGAQEADLGAPPSLADLAAQAGQRDAPAPRPPRPAPVRDLGDAPLDELADDGVPQAGAHARERLELASPADQLLEYAGAASHDGEPAEDSLELAFDPHARSVSKEVVAVDSLELAFSPARPATTEQHGLAPAPSASAAAEAPPPAAATPASAAAVAPAAAAPPAVAAVERMPAPEVEAGQELGATRELFATLDKAIKILNLYEGRGDASQRALEQVHSRLEALLARGPLALRVTPYEFLVGEEPVYTNEEDRSGLSYRLFRDGVRELQLLPGLDRDELGELVAIMRATRLRSDEEDSVTLLWDLELPHVRHQAIDIFVEGFFDKEGTLRAQLDELVADARAPLHSAEAAHAEQAAQLRREALAKLDARALEQARAWRREHLAQLRAAAADELRAATEGRALVEDLWRRAIHVLSRLMQHQPGDARIAELLAGVLEGLLRGERWEVLAAACRAIGGIRGDERSSEAGLRRAIDDSLLRLCARERLLALGPTLSTCTVAELAKLSELFRILPAAANQHLVHLLGEMPAGETQERMLALLGERHADLTDFHRRRLRSSNVAHVLAAVAWLKSSRSPHALPAIRGVLGHPHPKVRLEVVRVLRAELGEADVPALIGCLALDHRELQELVLEVLERIPARRHVPGLLEQVKSSDFDDWPPHRRRRTLQLLVRWGGPEANEFVVKRIAALNPLRRSKVEIARQDMIEAVAAVGGPRAQKIFDACLASRLPDAAREAVSAALRRPPRGQS